jgi:Pregnancy-associated plasma protein-A
MRNLHLPFLLSIALFSGSVSAGAQQQAPIRQCGSSPRYRNLDQSVLEKLQIADQSAEKVFGLVPESGMPKYEIRNIKVVVHVLYNAKTATSPEIGKIDVAQIASQIAALNRDYNPPIAARQSSIVPLRFRDRYASPMLTFTLAKSEWVPTKTTLFTDADEAKQAPSGVAPLDTDHRLNIYVVPALVDSNGAVIMGYSSWPGEPASKDGVVIQYQNFGTTGTAKAPFNLGHTTSHEVGHWFNLHHLWGDRPDNLQCLADDGVDDTPRQDGPTQGCPVPTAKPKACDNNADGRMFPNYMDYTYDACMSMFTVGQVIRLRTTITTLRPQLGH